MSQQYKLFVEDRHYEKVKICYSKSLKEIHIPSIDFISNKLFNQDLFEYDDNKIKIIHSSVRESENIPGVLVCNTQKTYGRKKDKFYYKCIPDDVRLPIFLIPYKIKLGFNKNISNKYIIFKFNNWNHKRPIGTMLNNFGDVNKLESFYEYQLYCKSLYASIHYFQKKTIKALRHKTEMDYVNIMIEKYKPIDRLKEEVITIDGDNCKDFDDAMSFKETNENIVISIYIANVSYWLDILDLWDAFSMRISTIYLPDRKRPMLPTLLSDALCSLTENHIRFAFTLDLYIDKINYDIIKTEYHNTIIDVKKNLRYDTEKMEKNKVYRKIRECVEILNKKKDMKYVNEINSSHDVIAYLMILMNYITAKKLLEKKSGLFRTAKSVKNFNPPKEIPKKVSKFLKIWNSEGGNYSKYSNSMDHEILDLDAYVHITSPIRRLPDLLNMLIIQDQLNLFKFTKKSKTFYDKWLSDESISYINKTMRSIRRVQNDCSLLNICSTDKSLLEKVYDGYIFDKLKRNDKLYQYMVYLPELKMMNRFISKYEEKVISKQKFKIYIFIDENRLKQKIRVERQREEVPLI